MNREDRDFPPLLKEINDPPQSLFVRGNIEPLLDKDVRILCVVGSRRYSNYAKEAVEKLIAGLKGYPVCIVSGLALGVDSIAHRSALENNIYTISFPGSGLDPSVIYPSFHAGLSEDIVESGGALLSEFDPLEKAAKWTFPSRNRLMAGVSHATLVVEAGLKSGTLITYARAMDYNRDVAAIPGPIFSPLSAGPHMLIRNGATPVTCVDDLLEFIGFARRNGQSILPLDDLRLKSLGNVDREIINILLKGPVSKDVLVRQSGLETQRANLIISTLELEGFIKEEMGVVRVV
ncbi:MAG: DNA-processing protein DprA [bacterium]|nr:DNA-processing protein DprA [bacterium]